MADKLTAEQEDIVKSLIAPDAKPQISSPEYAEGTIMQLVVKEGENKAEIRYMPDGSAFHGRILCEDGSYITDPGVLKALVGVYEYDLPQSSGSYGVEKSKLGSADHPHVVRSILTQTELTNAIDDGNIYSRFEGYEKTGNLKPLDTACEHNIVDKERDIGP